MSNKSEYKDKLNINDVSNEKYSKSRFDNVLQNSNHLLEFENCVPLLKTNKNYQTKPKSLTKSSSTIHVQSIPIKENIGRFSKPNNKSKLSEPSVVKE